MRLYLSSFRLGNHATRLLELVKPTARVAAIMNALDPLPVTVRQQLVTRLEGDFATIGLNIEELDLRNYFGSTSRLADDLAEFDLVWASGGNAFTLLMAMTQSGCGDVLKGLLHDDAIAYGGYSAGAIVAGPTLRGIDLVDSADPVAAAPAGYVPDIQWAGLGLVEYSVVPHFRSNHPESAAIESVVAYLEDRALPYKPLRDGEVILVDGATEQMLTLEE